MKYADAVVCGWGKRKAGFGEKEWEREKDPEGEKVVAGAE